MAAAASRLIWICWSLSVFSASSSAFAQYATDLPKQLIPLELAVCRVVVDDRRPGQQSHGSGCLFQIPARPDKRYVLTALHVLQDRRTDVCRVTWDGQAYFRFRLLAGLSGPDVAVLGPVDPLPDLPYAVLTPAPPTSGETLYACGFGGAHTNTLRWTGGPIFLIDKNDYDFYGFARMGDSGGPVFHLVDSQPYLVAALWGTGRDNGAFGVRCGKTEHIYGMFQVDQQTPLPDTTENRSPDT